MMDRSTETGRAARERPDGWWYPYIFVVFMAGVFVVNGVMVYFALDTFSGLETRDAYRKGMQYNRNIEKARAQEALLVLEFRFSNQAATGNARRHRRHAQGPRRSTGHGRAVAGWLHSPNLGRSGCQTALGGKRSGTLLVDVALPRPGQWDSEFSRNAAGIVFEIHRIRVP